MKTTVRFYVAIMLCFLIVSPAMAQNKMMQKQLKKELSQKIKTLKKEKWELYGSSRSLEVALLSHYEKLNDGNCQELVGVSSNCQKMNVCIQAAQNNAINIYASNASTMVRGRTASEVGLKDETEVDNFVSAYERLVSAEIKGVFKESFKMRRLTPAGYEFQIYYTINDAEAAKAREVAAMKAARQERIEFSKQISDFINEGFQTQQ